MGRVIIGMDPHKRSATIEIIDDLGPHTRRAVAPAIQMSQKMRGQLR